MKALLEEISKKYKVDGENERYATVYESKNEVEENMDVEIFEEKFNVDIEKVNFPVITFDNANAVDGWLYEAHVDKEEILIEADDYFDKK